MKNQLINLIEENVVSPYKEEVIKLIRPYIRIQTIPATDEIIPIGSSKLGGLPDLPISISWAISPYDGNFLPFLAQINFQDVKKYDEENLLPEKGILYFFSEYDHGIVLFFHGNNAELKRSQIPENFKMYEKRTFWQTLFNSKSKSRIFNSYKINFSLEYNIPPHDSYYFDKIQDETQATIKPNEAFSEYFYDQFEILNETETASNHHLLGYANNIQDGHLEPIFPQNENPNPLDWILLLQIDSDDNTQMNWGDWGRIYFFIEKEALKRADFSNIYIEGDCY